MRRINGELYRKMKGHNGKIWWVKLTDSEVVERDLFHLVIIAVPTLLFLAGCVAGGFLK